MNRKIWTLEEKLGVVLAMLKGEELRKWRPHNPLQLFCYMSP